MKEIIINQICTYEIKNTITHVTINKGLRKALINLEKFSHCVILTKTNDRLYYYSVPIIKLDINKGVLQIETNKLIGKIVDIKPYFPCEEKIKDYCTNSHFLIPFKGVPVGKYKFINKSGLIQLFESECLTRKDIGISIGKIKIGDYLRVLWWFDRFDKKKYRESCMCQPPYDNAPRSGIFSTRSPVRPNPIGSTIVKVMEVDKDNHFIKICGFDGFENTNILQITPYNEVTIFDNVKVPEWVEHWTNYKTFDISDSKDDFINNHNKDIKSEEFKFVRELEPKEKNMNQINNDEIIVEHARINNLKDISLSIPKGRITVITGVSGSGKSSLAFDTIYNESRNKFLDIMSISSFSNCCYNDTKVDRVIGLPPAVAINQNNLAMNPRSTVGTITKASDYIKLLFATIGERYCPYCHNKIVNNVCGTCGAVFLKLTKDVFSYNNKDYMCPVCKGLSIESQVDIKLIIKHPERSILDGASTWWGNLRKHREKPNANWMKGEALALADDLNENLEVPFTSLSKEYKHELFYGSNGRKVSLNYENSNGSKGTITRPVEGVVNAINRLLKESNNSYQHLDKYIVKKKCSFCNGERLNKEGRSVKILNFRYPEVIDMDILNLRKWCHITYNKLSNEKKIQSKNIFIKLLSILNIIISVGLSYLSLDRSVPSLSGGEAQRLKLVTQFNKGLSNILYILDEPSKGLHPKDYQCILNTIYDLQKLNNTIIIVEHNKVFIDIADCVIKLGPKAGKYGGNLISIDRNKHKEESSYLSYKNININYNLNINSNPKPYLLLKGAKTNNLKNIDIKVPLSKLTCVTGVSGSGKSSLISETLYPAVLNYLGKQTEITGIYKEIIGVKRIKDVVYVSQNSIGKTNRSNPATYTGVFDLIRKFYSKLELAKNSNMTKEYFSFNSKKGQCTKCKGTGLKKISMDFMSDIYTICPECKGKRYKDNVLNVKYKGYSISDILDLEVSEAKEIFNEVKGIYNILLIIDKVGLGYIKLGQSATTLSGGECQRLKLAKELSKGRIKDILYIMDEPTVGLHDEDVKRVINIVKDLTDKGATVIVIEHNPLFIKQSDWVIELGPKGGNMGGYVLKQGENLRQ